MPKIVALVIRAREALTDKFKGEVISAHPGCEIEFRDIDPRNAKETYDEAVNAGERVIVILRPDPLIADLIANGVPCIPITPPGTQLMRIESFDVNLTAYEP